MLVCYDLRFPELARAYAVAGAEMLLLAAAWPQARRAHWDLLLQARAVENLLFMAAVNRVGEGRFGPFGGGSAVIAPDGRVVARAEQHPQVLLATVDLAQVAARRAAFPALDDRRPSCYAL